MRCLTSYRILASFSPLSHLSNEYIYCMEALYITLYTAHLLSKLSTESASRAWLYKETVSEMRNKSLAEHLVLTRLIYSELYLLEQCLVV